MKAIRFSWTQTSFWFSTLGPVDWKSSCSHFSQCLDQTPGASGSGGVCVNTVWTILSRGNKKISLLARMHALASKSLNRDRELTPRYYYKLSEKVSCLGRIKNLIRLFFTFLFTQVRIHRLGNIERMEIKFWPGWCYCPDNCLHDFWCCNFSQHREGQSYGDTLHGCQGKQASSKYFDWLISH